MVLFSAGARRGRGLSAAELSKQLTQRHGRNADGRVTDPVRNHQRLAVHQRTARIDDVGYVAVLLVGSRAQQRLASVGR